MSSDKYKRNQSSKLRKASSKYEIYQTVTSVGDPPPVHPPACSQQQARAGPLGTHHVMAGLHILPDAVADERRLRGAIDKRYKFVLVVFGEVFVFDLRGKRKLRQG